jgi:tRNA-dihydrouridine synthase B
MRTVAIAPQPRLALAPMAGVTDRPFRMLCRQLGADVAASEMVTSDVQLWHTAKSLRRMDQRGEPGPRVVQIAGGDPEMMVEAARRNVEAGAEAIDINMGCPAKKVCNRAAGSALLRDEALVAAILDAVVAAVDVPVTLKLRTGWDTSHRNGVEIARLAERTGIQGLAVHGRTRADHYQGTAEYDTIRAIKASVTIPVFANGDIDSGAKARAVLEHTGADGIMIGRAAQGRPWIFREIRHFLATGRVLEPPAHCEVRDIMLTHLEQLYAFYGEHAGIRVARKHLGWYRDAAFGGAAPAHPDDESTTRAERSLDALFRELRVVESVSAQRTLAREWFEAVSERAAAADRREPTGRTPVAGGRQDPQTQRRLALGG